MRDWLRLLRLPLAPTAAWDAVASTALGLSAAGRDVTSLDLLSWAGLVLTSLCLYAFGMVANDLADRRIDAARAPDRPLPSGAISSRSASAAVVLLGALALALGGGPAGSRTVVLAALGGALLYDFVTKRFVVLGAASMGFVRFANASLVVVPLVWAHEASGVAFAGPLAIGLYSAAITVWSTTEERDLASRRLAARVLGVLAFGLAALVPWYVTGTLTLGVLLGAGVVTSLAFGRTPKKAPPKRQVLEMLLGLYFLSACVASGANGGSLAAGGVAILVAFALIYGSQIAIRWLGRRPVQAG